MIHRAEYQNVLYRASLEAGATVLFDSKVEIIDEYAPSVTLTSGKVLKADVIIGADGNIPKFHEYAAFI